MGIDPHSIAHIRKALEKGLGTIDNVQILGENLADVVRPFKKTINELNATDVRSVSRFLFSMFP